MRYIEVCLVVLLSCSAPAHIYLSNSQVTRNREARKSGEYNFRDDQAGARELARFGQELKRELKSKAYIIAYAARIFRHGDTKASSMAHMERGLLAYRYGGIEWDRIVPVDGGFREQPSIELYVVPPGAPAPNPHPSVPASEVVYCPLIQVQGPLFVWDATKPMSFRAFVSEETMRITPTFNWSVSKGEIVEGQGTPHIVVSLPGAKYERVTATAKIGGYSPECQSNESALSPEQLISIPHLIRAFPDIGCEEELAELNDFAHILTRETELQGYVVFYGGRNFRGRLAMRGEAEARADRIRRHLIEERGLPPTRFGMVNGGYKEEWTAELWVSPAGAKPPTPSPTLRPGQIRFRDGRVSIGKFICSG